MTASRTADRTYINARPLVPGSDAHVGQIDAMPRQRSYSTRAELVAYLARVNGGGRLIGASAE